MHPRFTAGRGLAWLPIVAAFTAPADDSPSQRLEPLCRREARPRLADGLGRSFALHPVPVVLEGGVQDILLRLMRGEVTIPTSALPDSLAAAVIASGALITPLGR